MARPPATLHTFFFLLLALILIPPTLSNLLLSSTKTNDPISQADLSAPTTSCLRSGCFDHFCISSYQLATRQNRPPELSRPWQSTIDPAATSQRSASLILQSLIRLLRARILQPLEVAINRIEKSINALSEMISKFEAPRKEEAEAKLDIVLHSKEQSEDASSVSECYVATGAEEESVFRSISDHISTPPPNDESKDQFDAIPPPIEEQTVRYAADCGLEATTCAIPEEIFRISNRSAQGVEWGKHAEANSELSESRTRRRKLCERRIPAKSTELQLATEPGPISTTIRTSDDVPASNLSMDLGLVKFHPFDVGVLGSRLTPIGTLPQNADLSHTCESHSPVFKTDIFAVIIIGCCILGALGATAIHIYRTGRRLVHGVVNCLGNVLLIMTVDLSSKVAPDSKRFIINHLSQRSWRDKLILYYGGFHYAASSNIPNLVAQGHNATQSRLCKAAAPIEIRGPVTGEIITKGIRTIDIGFKIFMKRVGKLIGKMGELVMVGFCLIWNGIAKIMKGIGKVMKNGFCLVLNGIANMAKGMARIMTEGFWLFLHGIAKGMKTGITVVSRGITFVKLTVAGRGSVRPDGSPTNPAVRASTPSVHGATLHGAISDLDRLTSLGRDTRRGSGPRVHVMASMPVIGKPSSSADRMTGKPPLSSAPNVTGEDGRFAPPAERAGCSRRSTVTDQGRTALITAQQRKMSMVDVAGAATDRRVGIAEMDLRTSQPLSSLTVFAELSARARARSANAPSASSEEDLNKPPTNSIWDADAYVHPLPDRPRETLHSVSQRYAIMHENATTITIIGVRPSEIANVVDEFEKFGKLTQMKQNANYMAVRFSDEGNAERASGKEYVHLENGDLLGVLRGDVGGLFGAIGDESLVGETTGFEPVPAVEKQTEGAGEEVIPPSSSAHATSTAYEQSPHPDLYQSRRSTSVSSSSPVISDAAPRHKSTSTAPEPPRVSVGDITVVSSRPAEAPSSPAGSLVNLPVDNDTRAAGLRVGDGVVTTSTASADDGKEEPDELSEGRVSSTKLAQNKPPTGPAISADNDNNNEFTPVLTPATAPVVFSGPRFPTSPASATTLTAPIPFASATSEARAAPPLVATPAAAPEVNGNGGKGQNAANGGGSGPGLVPAGEKPLASGSFAEAANPESEKSAESPTATANAQQSADGAAEEGVENGNIPTTVQDVPRTAAASLAATMNAEAPRTMSAPPKRDNANRPNSETASKIESTEKEGGPSALATTGTQPSAPQPAPEAVAPPMIATQQLAAATAAPTPAPSTIHTSPTASAHVPAPIPPATVTPIPVAVPNIQVPVSVRTAPVVPAQPTPAALQPQPQQTAQPEDGPVTLEQVEVSQAAAPSAGQAEKEGEDEGGEHAESMTGVVEEQPALGNEILDKADEPMEEASPLPVTQQRIQIPPPQFLFQQPQLQLQPPPTQTPNFARPQPPNAFPPPSPQPNPLPPPPQTQATPAQSLPRSQNTNQDVMRVLMGNPSMRGGRGGGRRSMMSGSGRMPIAHMRRSRIVGATGNMGTPGGCIVGGGSSQGPNMGAGLNPVTMKQDPMAGTSFGGFGPSWGMEAEKTGAPVVALTPAFAAPNVDVSKSGFWGGVFGGTPAAAAPAGSGLLGTLKEGKGKEPATEVEKDDGDVKMAGNVFGDLQQEGVHDEVEEDDDGLFESLNEAFIQNGIEPLGTSSAAGPSSTPSFSFLTGTQQNAPAAPRGFATGQNVPATPKPRKVFAFGRKARSTPAATPAAPTHSGGGPSTAPQFHFGQAGGMALQEPR
ncbi:hypothetical protein HK097_000712, partial [Rhizophlyctis rosea]